MAKLLSDQDIQNIADWFNRIDDELIGSWAFIDGDKWAVDLYEELMRNIKITVGILPPEIDKDDKADGTD
jgi:hypothetical protein